MLRNADIIPGIHLSLGRREYVHVSAGQSVVAIDKTWPASIMWALIENGCVPTNRTQRQCLPGERDEFLGPATVVAVFR
jgi:hypothetical protein